MRSKSAVCISAQYGINISEVLTRIIDEEVYKRDYDNLTMQLLEEQVSYETVIETLKKIADSKIFI